MSESEEDFLARWSRRKREAAAPEPEQPEVAAETEQPPIVAEDAKAVGKGETSETPTELFDISKLPSLDSITAETDIRPFLAAGVPAHLTQAALRRVWSADPKIRDFIEIAENQWDFASGAVPGFDMSPPTGVQEMLADIFGKAKKVVENADLLPEEAKAEPAPPQSSVSREQAPALHLERSDSTGDESPTSRVTDSSETGDKTAQIEAAPQQEEKPEAEIPVLPRRHGSALPT